MPNVRDKQIQIVSYEGLRNKLYFEYDFININEFEKKELLEKNSMVAYAMAIDKYGTNEEIFEVLNQLANLIKDETRKKYVKRLVIHIFKDCLEESARSEIIEKINKGDGVNMKCSWDYVIEDFMKQKQKIAENAKQEGKQAGFLEGMSNLIKNMLEHGESIEKIKLYSGLSVKEIKEIEKQLKIVI